jgi:hypothetical protein
MKSAGNSKVIKNPVVQKVAKATGVNEFVKPSLISDLKKAPLKTIVKLGVASNPALNLLSKTPLGEKILKQAENAGKKEKKNKKKNKKKKKTDNTKLNELNARLIEASQQPAQTGKVIKAEIIPRILEKNYESKSYVKKINKQEENITNDKLTNLQSFLNNSFHSINTNIKNSLDSKELDSKCQGKIACSLYAKVYATEAVKKGMENIYKTIPTYL